MKVYRVKESFRKYFEFGFQENLFSPVFRNFIEESTIKKL